MPNVSEREEFPMSYDKELFIEMELSRYKVFNEKVQ